MSAVTVPAEARPVIVTLPMVTVTVLNLAGVLCLSAWYSRRVIATDTTPQFTSVFGVGVVMLMVGMWGYLFLHSLVR